MSGKAQRRKRRAFRPEFKAEAVRPCKVGDRTIAMQAAGDPEVSSWWRDAIARPTQGGMLSRVDAMFGIKPTPALSRCARLLLVVAVSQRPALGQVSAPNEINEAANPEPACADPGCARLPENESGPTEAQPSSSEPTRAPPARTIPPRYSTADCAPPPAPAPMPCPCSASGQLPRDVYRHDGFFFNVEMRLGYMWDRIDAKSGWREPGLTTARGLSSGIALTSGGTVARGLVVGGALSVSSIDDIRYEHDGVTTEPVDDSVRLALMFLGPIVRWYPEPARGWFVGGGVGLAGVVESDERGEAIEPNANGAALSATAGYEWWVARQLSLGLALRFEAAWARARGRVTREEHEAILTALALQYTYH